MLKQYKYQKQKLVFTKELFERYLDFCKTQLYETVLHRKLRPPITPIIFAKKNMQIKIPKQTTPYLIAFENYLNLVCQLYYKASFRPAEVPANDETHNYFKLGDTPPVLVNKPKGKPGRKARKKTPSQSEDGRDHNTDSKDAGLTTTKDKEKASSNEAHKNMVHNVSLFYTDVLDTLISPLKVDYPFGNLIINCIQKVNYSVELNFI